MVPSGRAIVWLLVGGGLDAVMVYCQQYLPDCSNTGRRAGRAERPMYIWCIGGDRGDSDLVEEMRYDV